MKILVIGHGRHGKDTVCEVLRDEFGLKFMASSLFCAERVVLLTFPPGTYASAQECFEDRARHRKHWFDAIAAHCAADKARLAREIFAEHDVYAGIRSRREFWAVVNGGVSDLVLWVDAADRQPKENPDSMQLEPWMADFVVDNNGSQEEMREQVRLIMRKVLYKSWKVREL